MLEPRPWPWGGGQYRVIERVVHNAKTMLVPQEAVDCYSIDEGLEGFVGKQNSDSAIRWRAVRRANYRIETRPDRFNLATGVFSLIWERLRAFHAISCLSLTITRVAFGSAPFAGAQSL